MSRLKKQKSEIEKLAALGPERLARMLHNEAGRYEEVERHIELAVSGQESLQALIAGIKKSFGRYTNSRLAGAWKKSFPLSRELVDIRKAIVETILPKSPKAVCELLERMVKLHVAVLGNVDDSYGVLGDVFRQAVSDWGAAYARIPDRDAKVLAMMVFQKIMSNDYGMYDSIVPAFGEALGETGLAELENLTRKELSQIPLAQPNENQRNIDENRSKRFALCHTLEEIADLRDDSDGFIEAVTLLGRPMVYCREIAERLMKRGRIEEALDWLYRYDGPHQHDTVALKAKGLTALGREAEARDMLWQDFVQTLSQASYAGVLELTPQKEIEERQKEAVNIARAHRRIHDALSFLMAQGFLSDAASQVIDRWKELDGDTYSTLRPAAEKLAADFPLAAVLLRRCLVDAILEKGQSKHYRYAIEDLMQADILSRMVKDWHYIETQEHYLSRLRDRHGKKSSFWSRYN
ncbi:MAG: hypothetical protein A2Z50_04305 [Nitrospirae bacterium RBG_19FT_COMBO_42_15]|nr:MAG: hypothetical protein A2Z50_04305 [Nitrospirae bacterium RBG_19FT_COMBO_42_15]